MISCDANKIALFIQILSMEKLLFYFWILLLFVTNISSNVERPFFGTFNISWYPEIQSSADMREYLRTNVSLMTTARVSFYSAGREALTAIVGTNHGNKPYTLTQCILDLFTSNVHRIQFVFGNAIDLNQVIEVLMLKDSPRIWLHLEVIPFPGTTNETTKLLQQLNEAIRWSQMVLSVGAQPSRGTGSDVYSMTSGLEMKRLTEQEKLMNMSTVFVLDGYVVHKQPNFTGIVKNLILLDRVSFVLRIDPDKEDKVIVTDLNTTMYALGGKFRVYLDISHRLRRILLSIDSYGMLKMDTENKSIFDQPCINCHPMIVRKLVPCSAEVSSAFFSVICLSFVTVLLIGGGFM